MPMGTFSKTYYTLAYDVVIITRGVPLRGIGFSLLLEKCELEIRSCLMSNPLKDRDLVVEEGRELSISPWLI